jgi:hypothetical protein
MLSKTHVSLRGRALEKAMMANCMHAQRQKVVVVLVLAVVLSVGAKGRSGLGWGWRSLETFWIHVPSKLGFGFSA